MWPAENRHFAATQRLQVFRDRASHIQRVTTQRLHVIALFRALHQDALNGAMLGRSR